MTKDEFRMLLSETCSRLVELTMTKGEEYARSHDQLANFKRSGEEAGIDPLKVWLVFYNKHADAIKSYIRNCGEYTAPLSEPIDGRIDDAILYLCLLKGLVAERREVDRRREVKEEDLP